MPLFFFYVVTQVLCQTRTQFCQPQKVVNGQLLQYTTLFLQQQQINKVSLKAFTYYQPLTKHALMRYVMYRQPIKRKYRKTSLNIIFVQCNIHNSMIFLMAPTINFWSTWYMKNIFGPVMHSTEMLLLQMVMGKKVFKYFSLSFLFQFLGNPKRSI